MTFQPSRFWINRGQLAVTEPDPPDAEHLPARPLVGRQEELFGLVPLNLARHMCAPDRLLVLILFLARARARKAENGWHRLSPDCCGLVGLDQRQRRRAIEALEGKGLIEVRRRKGKSPEVRLLR